MPVSTRAWFLVGLAATVMAEPGALRAQAGPELKWNEQRALDLVALATARRSAQLADTGLTDYTATAHGYLTFLAQLGEGFPDPPKVVRADEIAVEVYWHAPNRSKQRVVGRRDTLLLPTDIAYHRDHLGIVQNNFPAVIRVGEGDEVRDVPHPLSPQGTSVYDYALGDSLTIRSGDRKWDVQMIRVRPRDDTRPAVVGAVFIDRETAAVVRMTFSFTRSALIDAQLEDVSITLDNGLVDGRFWLPRVQEVEIRRTGEWLDFPARGIIRGRWDICCVVTNQQIPLATFAGPEITFAPPGEQRSYPFKGTIMDSLPAESRVAESIDAQRVQEEARALVRAEALRRSRRITAGASRASDLVRVNRVEGLAVGAAATFRLGAGMSVTPRARFGTADHAFKHRTTLAWTSAAGASLSLTAQDDARSAGDEPEVSGARNSISAQESGSDFTDDYRVRGAALAFEWGAVDRVRWHLGVERSTESAYSVHARPASGRFRPAFAADPLTATRLSIGVAGGEYSSPLGLRLRSEATAAISIARRDAGLGTSMDATWTRVSWLTDAEWDLSAGKLVSHTLAAGVFGPAPPMQAIVLLGGPVTAPGYDVHSLRSVAGVSQRVEWQFRVGSFRLPLGRFGTPAVPVTLAPFAHVSWTDVAGSAPGAPSGVRPSAGLALITLLDAVRLDLARGFRDGRWVFSADLGRFLWRVL